MADFYDNQSLGWGATGQDVVQEEEEAGQVGELHRGYTRDLIEVQDDEEQMGDTFDAANHRPGQLSTDGPEPPTNRRRADTLLEEERAMIGNIVGDDAELRQLFGIVEDDSTVTDTNTYASGDREFISIKDLPVDHRLKYLRSFLAKIHNFQLTSEAENPPAAAGTTLPIISTKANILTSVLGGDISATGGLWPTLPPRPELRPASTQTDPPKPYATSALPPAALDPTTRRKLHRSVNSPGYAYADVISVDARGDLWKRYTPPVVKGRKPQAPRSVPHQHRALKCDARPEPKVTGWAEGGAGDVVIGGGGGRGRRGGRKVGRKKPDVKGNDLLKAAGLLK